MPDIKAVPFPKIEEIEIRDLDPIESAKLLPALKKLGSYIPLPNYSAVTVAEYHGEIVGFIVGQLIPHAEPIWVSEDWRGLGLGSQLYSAVHEKMEDKPFISIAQNVDGERLCRNAGDERDRGSQSFR